MAIALNKKTGINLKKGSSISLEKDGKSLQDVCIGLNWGAIEKRVFFGMFSHSESVDLDGSITMFDKNDNDVDTVCYSKLVSSDGSIRHSGDDLSGDSGGDDGIDNEIIQIDLRKVDPKIENIFIYLNSFKGQDFSAIPYSKIRVFEGNKTSVKSVFATFNLSADPSHKGHVSMIMGKLFRKNNGWEFFTIGESITVKDINGTIKVIKGKYL